ncbi:MAG: acyl-CoA thioesterase [Solirubrobacteraceae bacterium]|jgi:lysophospholipase L1-like esterase|nr:acyl-CoA thioesterase [Solirubrobacteraceae bacterium]
MLILGALILISVAGTAVAYSGSPSSAPGVAPAGWQRPVVRARAEPQQPGRRSRPLLAVVGASVSAGVGAGNLQHAWPQDLARMLHWRVLVSADPGAGYVNPGAGHRGPFSRLASRLDLGRLDPRLILIQGGHDDIGQPLPLISDRVESLVTAIRREAPHARLAVLSVFARGNRPSSETLATDRTILAAARHADPTILAFDPLARHWKFPRIGDHLHPSAAGHQWIAKRLAAGLRERFGDGLSTAREFEGAPSRSSAAPPAAPR